MTYGPRQYAGIQFPGGPPLAPPPSMVRAVQGLTDYSVLQVYPEDARSNILLKAYFGEGTITTTGGGGGIVAVPRPQKKPITVWRGPQDAYTHEIPLVVSRLTDIGASLDHSIEQDLAWLEQISGVDMFNLEQPPLLILNAGGALPHDVFHSPQLRWVVPEEPVWGEAFRPRGYTERTQQLVTVKFMAWTGADELTRTVPTQVNSKYVYVAKQGDTYKSIAARELKSEGGAKWGNRLAQLNGARDGAASPGVGQSVKIPTAAEVKTWGQKPRR